MIRKTVYLLAFFAFFVGPVATRAAPAGRSTLAWDDLPPEIQTKVDPRLLAEFRGETIPAHLGGERVQLPAGAEPKPLDKTLFLVYLAEQPDLEAIIERDFTSLTAQRNAVTNSLLVATQRMQQPVRSALDERLAAGKVNAYYPFYIFNGLAVEGDLNTVIELALRQDVKRIVANFPLVRLGAAGTPAQPLADTDLGGLGAENWNIDLVDAERVWQELGVDGTGAVVADFDSGAQWDHPALQNSYRGWDGTRVDHDYNWFAFNGTNPDYWDMNGNYGPSVFPMPIACDDHGVHTLGTMVGNGATPGTQIGMAPGAKWIAVPGLCQPVMLPWGYESIIGAIRTFQWLMCPTDMSGDLATRDCSKAPDVINNSWGSSNPADETFRPIIQSLRAAGIVPVFASGNPDAGFGSIGSPGSVPEAITVGATDIDDQVASFSGRGPSFYEGVQKPNLVAPGVDIFSSISNGGYREASGTSMAAPAVSGLVALMISADLKDGRRDLSVDEIQAFLEHTARDFGAAGPDDEYGYGRIDAYKAVRWVLSAGDLSGTLTDAVTGNPIDGATLSGTYGSDTFMAQTSLSGFYSATVPAGSYQVDAKAFGYEAGSFAAADVVTGTAVTLDFKLHPLPTATLRGVIESGSPATPVGGATIAVDARPSLAFTTAADGSYNLVLPLGTHDLTVKLHGYRIAHQTVTITAEDLTQNIALQPAPTILLVEADAYYGWFINRPAANFFKWSLDRRDYLYDEAQIITSTLPVLTGYDLVIDIHTANFPRDLGWNTVLENYLDHGGRLIISGQDVGGASDEDKIFYEDYLHATLVDSFAAGLGDTVSGLGFLDGLNLSLNEAALYGYDNTMLPLNPDAVQPHDGASFPIMAYDNGRGAAALAVAPCAADYRAVYFAVGYENLGPRADNRPEAYAEVLDRSIQWVMGNETPERGLNVHILPPETIWPAGSVYTYTLTVANAGRLPDAFNLALAGNLWPTTIYSGTTPVSETIALAPCAAQALQVSVEIPASAPLQEKDIFTVTASSQSQPLVTSQSHALTTAFPDWQARYNQGSQTSFWLAGAVHQCTPYAIGGLSKEMETRQATQAYDPSMERWVQRASKPTGVYGTQAAVIDGKFYLPGGFTNPDAADWAATNVLEIYDPRSDTWSHGANLPGVRGGLSAAASNGKLYVFGGGPTNIMADIETAVWEYDPQSDTWTVRGAMPYSMIFGGATALGGKIYVGGDYRGYRDFYEYDPLNDTWVRKADFPAGGRHAPLLVAANERVYLYGGDSGGLGLPYTTAFAYQPAGDRWGEIAENIFYHEAGVGVFAAGQLWAYGGNSWSFSSEAVRVSDSFCNSEKRVQQGLIRPGERITYTLNLHSEPDAALNVRIFDLLPPGTTFAGFGPTSLVPAPVFNPAENRVEWQGSLAGGLPPLPLTFGVIAGPSGWRNGDRLSNSAIFMSDPDLIFTRTAASLFSYFDLSSAVQKVDKPVATAGEDLVYTIQLTNTSLAAGNFVVSDRIPEGTSFVPGSLSVSTGEAGLTGDRIHWHGELPLVSTLYSNDTDRYAWGDSDGQGEVSGVAFDWQNMAGATPVGSVNALEHYFGPFALKFPFTFFGSLRQEFSVSSFGWLAFRPELGNWVPCSGFGLGKPDNFITGYGGEASSVLQVTGPAQILYKVIGGAPRRSLVIQYLDIPSADQQGGPTLDMQIILYEGSNNILIQYNGMSVSTTTANGISGSAPFYPARLYGDQCEAPIHNGLAVLYVPPGSTHTQIVNQQATLSFAVRTSQALPGGTRIINTAVITDSNQVVYTRLAETVLEAVATDTPTPSATVTPTDTSTVTHTATPTRTSEPPTCRVDYAVNQWQNGFTAQVRITNNGPTAIQGWALTWRFDNGQQITGWWNATLAQNGAGVTASNPAGHWNGTIAANGGSVSFGFQATYTGNNQIPGDFAVNGVACHDDPGGPTDTPMPTPSRTATRTNTVTLTPTPVAACRVDYAVNQWQNGFTAQVRITNNSPTAIQGWALTWRFDNGQQITGWWNATLAQNGAGVTASNPAGHWNGTIGANGGSVSFGFQATYTGNNQIPDDFAVNGAACRTGQAASWVLTGR